MPRITTVFFWWPNATMYWVPSTNLNWATDHSELKYFGNTPNRVKKRYANWTKTLLRRETNWLLGLGHLIPLNNDRDDDGDEEERVSSAAIRGVSLTWEPELTLRPKTWTVPLSLETASHSALEEKARLYISALSAPLLTCTITSRYCHRAMESKLVSHKALLL